MELTPSLVASKGEEYRSSEPLFTVEQGQIETLPAALRERDFHWRDIEWVVRWYYRRFLGAYPHEERTAREEAFRENDFETVHETLEAVSRTADVSERVERLTVLDGVDIPVASALLFFLDPNEYIVIGEREWNALRAVGELHEAYPDPPSAREYERYLATCRDVANRCECTMWALYRALWRLTKAGNSELGRRNLE